MIFGLISSYNEGRLTVTAVRSLLACCDRVLVLDGPIGDTPSAGDASVFYDGKKQPGNLFIRRGGPWASDAAKRTELIRWAQAQHEGPCWAVILDGDEALIWPEMLPDYIARSDASREGPGGIKIKLAFEDGQLYETGARVYRLDAVDYYVLSSYQMKLKGMETIWTSPLTTPQRAPFQGEPHIFHRGYLRPPARNAPALRQSKAEIDELAKLGIVAPWTHGANA